MERTFNALKFRFRWLLFPVFYHSIDTIYDAFRVAAILHNRLLKYDGFEKFDWENMDPNGEVDDDINNCATNFQDNNVLREDELVDLPLPEDISSNTQATALEPSGPTFVVTVNSETVTQPDVEDVEEVYNPISEQHNNVIKIALKKHLSYAYSNGQVQWPERFTEYHNCYRYSI